MAELNEQILKTLKAQQEQQKAFQEHQQEQQRVQQEQQRNLEERMIQLTERLTSQQLENNERVERRQVELIQAMNTRGQIMEDSEIFTQNAVWTTIETFKYEPDKDISFDSYYRRYEDLYTSDCANWSDAKKVRLLTRKLDTAEHTRFVDYILPRKTNQLTFQEAVKLLSELFSPKESLFHKRWKCLNLVREENEDYATFAAKVNKNCDDFKLSDLSSDNFKCLVFCQGLISTKDSEIRRRVLNKLESEPNLTLQQLAEDCQRFVSMKKDSKSIEESGVSHIRKVRYNKRYSPPPRRRKPEMTSSSPKKREKYPSSPCQNCGGRHWQSECNFRTKMCFNCNFKGHAASHCKKKSKRSYIKTAKLDKMDDGDNRKYVPIQILGKKIRLQLDSGSDLTILDLKTWKKLGKPTLLRTTKIARSVTGEKSSLKGNL